jgi:hypothetical protein
LIIVVSCNQLDRAVWMIRARWHRITVDQKAEQCETVRESVLVH